MFKHLKSNLKKYLTLLIVSIAATYYLLQAPAQHFKTYELNGHTLYLEVLSEKRDLEKGMMHRKSLDKNHGMLFVFPIPMKIDMWMKNTYIPLDIIFLDEAYKVTHIHKNATPLSTSLIPSIYPAKYVLEINANESDGLKVKNGDELRRLQSSEIN